MTSLTVELRGSDLPGRSCGPSPAGGWYDDIEVGLARGSETVDLVPGDANEARWSFEVTVRPRDEGEIDITGPFVHGARGERSFSLRWGTLAEDGSFVVFRGAKLRSSDIDQALVRRAVEAGGLLVGSLGLTDEQGWPRCASVRPPLVTWSVGRLAETSEAAGPGGR